MIIPDEVSPFLEQQIESLSPTTLYSAEAEKAVLGCMMAQPVEVIDEATISLLKEDFFVPAHQEIFGALREMHNAREAIDVMTIHQWLTDRKMAEAVGSPGILAELLVGFATHLNVGSYIRIVKDKALLRNLQGACSKIVEDIQEMPDSVPAVFDRAEQAILCVTQASVTQESEPAGKIARREMEAILSYDSSKPLTGLSSGLLQLDQLTTGWHPGEMIVVAARPGKGKSALGLLFADIAARSRWNEVTQSFVEPGEPVGMFDLEMTKEQKILRLISMRSGIPLQFLRRRTLHDMQKGDLRSTVASINNQLHIDDSSPLTIMQLRSKARRMVIKYGIQLLVIDYLQLIKASSKQGKDNRFTEVGEISRGIKSLAKELAIPIIALAQLNRRNEEGNCEPKLHNLRESGDIEQDADCVLLLHFPDEENKKLAHLIIAKQRNGPTDTIVLKFEPSTTLFSS